MSAGRRYQPYTPPEVETVYREAQRSRVTQAIAAAGVASPDRAPFPPHPLPGGPTGHVVLVFTAPSTPLSVNATNGRHYGTTHADKLAWQSAGREVALEYAEQLAPFRGYRVELTFCLPLVQWRRADGPNYASGISVKAAVDSIVRAGLLVPDDRSEWMEVSCVFWAGGESKDEVRVRVRSAKPPWDGSA